MRHFRRHADTFAQRGVRVNRLADVDGVGSHFDGQSRYADSTFNFGPGAPAQPREVGA